MGMLGHKSWTWQCVVEVGMPRRLQNITTMLAEDTTTKPREGVMGVILEPIVLMTRSPKRTRPIWGSQA